MYLKTLFQEESSYDFYDISTVDNHEYMLCTGYAKKYSLIDDYATNLRCHLYLKMISI